MWNSVGGGSFRVSETRGNLRQCIKYIQLHSAVCLFWKGFYKYFGEFRHFDIQLHTWATREGFGWVYNVLGSLLRLKKPGNYWQLPLVEHIIVFPSVLSHKGRSSLSPVQQPSEKHRVSVSLFHREGNWETNAPWVSSCSSFIAQLWGSPHSEAGCALPTARRCCWLGGKLQTVRFHDPRGGNQSLCPPRSVDPSA